MPHLSYSQVDTYLGCPRLWKYSRATRQPSHWAAVSGRVVHYGFELCLRAVAAGDPIPDFEDLNNLIAANWHTAAAEPSIRWNGVGDFHAHYRARQMVQALVSWGAFEHIRPLSADAIEQEFKAPLGLEGWTFDGRWDLITSTDTIIDLKTAAEPWTQQMADKTLQAEAYYWGFSHLYGRQPRQMTFLVVSQDWKRDPNGPPEVETFTTTRTKKQVEWFKEVAREVARAIQTQVYPPRPTYQWCPSCAFRKPCMETRGEK